MLNIFVKGAVFIRDSGTWVFSEYFVNIYQAEVAIEKLETRDMKTKLTNRKLKMEN